MAAPIITLPSVITVDEDSSDNSVAGIVLADEDDDTLTVTLSAEGTLSLGQLTGLTFVSGDGISDNTMTFSGSVADINAALSGLLYNPAANDDDGDGISISVDDGTGNVVEDTLGVTITPINDAPVISGDLTVRFTTGDPFIAITTDDIFGSDIEDSSTQLVVSRSNIFVLDGEPSTLGQAFTVADIEAGRVSTLGSLFISSPQPVREFTIWLTDSDGVRSEFVTFRIEENMIIEGASRDDFIVGGQFDDVLIGRFGDDHLAGNAGIDTLLGGQGDDTLLGGAGNDIIYGGRDDDYIEGNDGADLIFGDFGHDEILGNNGNDTIDASGGDDIAFGGEGADLIFGGSGEDQVFGSGGFDTVLGNAGNDYVNGGTGADILYGGPGNDTVVGESGNDRIEGNDGNDVLLGGEGTDIILGGDGNDRLEGGIDSDLLNGGAGIDLLLAGDGNDTLVGGIGDDRLEAGAGNDFLRGDDGVDQLKGDAGNDILEGGDGNDVLTGGEGADFLRGGAGLDRFVFAEGDALTSNGLDVIADLEVGENVVVGVHSIVTSFTGGGDTEVMLGATADPNVMRISIDRDGDGTAEEGIFVIGNFEFVSSGNALLVSSVVVTSNGADDVSRELIVSQAQDFDVDPVLLVPSAADLDATSEVIDLSISTHEIDLF